MRRSPASRPRILNVSGERDVVQAVHDVYASLFTDRAIAYRAHKGFDHAQVGISVGIQRMVRSDLGASGVMFTLDTDSGFRDVVFITSSYGLGETVVQGAVNPDEFYVYKPALAAGRKAVLRRNLGAKAIKMVYAERGAAEARRDGRGAGRAAPAVFADRSGARGARAPGRHDRASTTAAPWTSSGPRTAPRTSSSSCRPAGNRAEPQPPHACSGSR